MVIQQLTADHVEALDSHGPRFGKFGANLSMKDGVAWRYLTKDFGEVEMAGSGVIALFFLEAERESSADLLWAKCSGAVKMVVIDGPQKGMVGYYRPALKGAKA